MMKRNTTVMRFFALSLVLVLSSLTVHGQKRVDRADKAYANLRYAEAQELYLKALEKDDQDIKEQGAVFKNLGNTYYLNAEYLEAVKYYNSYFGDRTDGDAIDLLRYAQSLQAAGNPMKAEKYYKAFAEQGAADSGRMPLADVQALMELNAGRYDMQALTPLYDPEQITFGHAVREGKLIYATTEEKPKSFLNRLDPWNELSYLSLYEVPVNEKNEITGEPEKIRQLTKRFHEASPVFTEDGNTVYFTRSNFSSKDHSNKNVYLKIYRVRKKGDKWGKPEDLSINGDDFSTAHPALNAEETKLYFASNRDGGYGENDLYVVDIDDDGKLGEPENLGNKINTGGRETYPFVSEDNYLYFSSDGHFGMGGLDVFAVKINEDGSYGNVVNVGEPVNTYADDFSYGINAETKYGFVSSDRTVNGGSLVRTNIYSFKETRPLIETLKILIEGYVTEKDSGDAIPNATVAVQGPEEADPIEDALTDDEGYYAVEVDRNTRYVVTATKEGYKDKDEKTVEMKDENKQVDLQLGIDLTPGVDLAKALDILEIYFDFDKWDIRPDAERDIKKVLNLLEKYPQVKINIRSHTDSRGSMEYNDVLSERRAKATMDWLIDHGINADRLSSEGLGERELTNECKDGVPCTREQHQANRRSEFIILE